MMRNIRFWRSAGLAGIVALAATLATGTAGAGNVDVYSAGHADVNIFYESGALGLDYEFGSNAVINGVVLGAAGAGERPADSITTFINPANAAGVGPAGLPAPFAGNSLYTMPQTSKTGRPFLGIGAEEIEPGVFQNDTLTLTLTAITRYGGAGQFILWQNGSESNPFMNTADGLSTTDHVDVAAGGHDHYNWGFTSEGVYDLTFTASGTLANGTSLSTTEVFRFQVGTQAIPEPGSLTLVSMAVGTLGLVAARRKRGRDEAAATA